MRATEVITGRTFESMNRSEHDALRKRRLELLEDSNKKTLEKVEARYREELGRTLKRLEKAVNIYQVEESKIRQQQVQEAKRLEEALKDIERRKGQERLDWVS